MPYALWDSLFTGQSTRITKALYGSVLVRDYEFSTTALTNYSPFDPTTGNLSSTLTTSVALGGDGWTDLGFLNENGVSFTPKFQTNETMAWQSRIAQRTDVTMDEEEFVASFQQAGPRIDELLYNYPLLSLPSQGAIGYNVEKLNTPQILYRQVLVIGVDGSKGNNEFFAILYSRCTVTKVDKFDYNAKNVVESTMTFSAYPDPYSGFAVKRFREGPAWRAAGGVTSTPGTPVATPIVASPVITLGSATTGGSFAAGTYYWKVTAVTAAGESAGSNELTASLTSSQEQPINWTAVTGATGGYKVYRGTAAGAENVLVATVASGTNTYTDTGTAGSSATVPTVNTTLGHTASAHSVDLVFTAPTSINTPFTYGVSQRSPGGTGTGTAVATGNITIVSSTGASTTVNVSGLTAASTYDFDVTATGSNGSVSQASAYSNVVTSS